MSQEALRRLMAYHWPGNVRQLENVVERALAFSQGRSADRRAGSPAGDPEPAAPRRHARPGFPTKGSISRRYIEGVELALIRRSLERTQGNKRQAAKLLNLKRTTLIEKLKRLEPHAGVRKAAIIGSMPPRHHYWTIILEGKPTAFRAHTQEELLPTLRQLQARHPDAVMKWFARGRLWESQEEERADAIASAGRPATRPAGERRARDWRPGGEHKDPRERFKVPRDEKRRRFAENLRRERPSARNPAFRCPAATPGPISPFGSSRWKAAMEPRSGADRKAARKRDRGAWHTTAPPLRNRGRRQTAVEARCRPGRQAAVERDGAARGGHRESRRRIAAPSRHGPAALKAAGRRGRSGGPLVPPDRPGRHRRAEAVGPSSRRLVAAGRRVRGPGPRIDRRAEAIPPAAAAGSATGRQTVDDRGSASTERGSAGPASEAAPDGRAEPGDREASDVPEDRDAHPAGGADRPAAPRGGGKPGGGRGGGGGQGR